jgi:hypothetical protein
MHSRNPGFFNSGSYRSAEHPDKNPDIILWLGFSSCVFHGEAENQKIVLYEMLFVETRPRAVG